jgi:hypothetical protein
VTTEVHPTPARHEPAVEVMTEVFTAPELEKRVRTISQETDPFRRAQMAAPDFIDEEPLSGERNCR